MALARQFREASEEEEAPTQVSYEVWQTLFDLPLDKQFENVLAHAFLQTVDLDEQRLAFDVSKL